MPVRCHGKKNHVHTDTYISPVFSLMACCYVHGFSNSFSDCPLFSTLKYIFSTTIAKLPNFVVPGSPHSLLHHHCYLVWTPRIFVKSLLFQRQIEALIILLVERVRKYDVLPKYKPEGN
jgi:hypothetical protein